MKTREYLVRDDDGNEYIMECWQALSRSGTLGTRDLRLKDGRSIDPLGNGKYEVLDHNNGNFLVYCTSTDAP